MTIFWLGQSAFKIQDKEVTVAIDPYGEIGLKMPKFNAEVLLISHDHDDHNNKDAIKGDPFLIDGPGEYEVKNVFVYGIPAYHDDKEGAERGKVTMYLIEIDGVKIAHLSDFGQKSLTNEQLELLEGIDILLIPVGGHFTIDGEEAAKIVSQLQPRIVIPMHYKIPHLNIKLDPADDFLKEFGVTNPEKMDKLKISKKDLPQEETKVILLTPA
ncbi:MBL fold metallo-hydrolase [Candidatus Falkowbacteria bacterium]|nr:MBL fold metallo-hydrolase [Candidatus Falkowbacteria bacterium]